VKQSANDGVAPKKSITCAIVGLFLRKDGQQTGF